MSSFDDAVGFVLSVEGGYSNNPNDSGGATNMGITQSTLDGYRAGIEDPTSFPINVTDLTKPKASEIYRDSFWTPVHGDDLSWPVNLYLFDTSVNHGKKIAVILLQRALWIDDDGVLGINTVSSAYTCGKDERYAYLTLRRDWYRQRVKDSPSLGVFLKGWMNRVEKIWKFGEG